MENDPKLMAEAALFMSPSPLTIEEIQKVTGMAKPGKVLAMMDALVADFNAQNRSLELTRTDDNRYRMQVRSDFLSRVKHLAITVDFSKAILRTLAIIAFKQPIRQSIVVKMRGNKSYDHIKDLVEQGFVKGEKEANTLRLETTKKFEDYFGPPIKEKRDLLPTSQQTTLQQQIEALEHAEAAEQSPDQGQTTLADEESAPVEEPSTEVEEPREEVEEQPVPEEAPSEPEESAAEEEVF